MRRTRGIAATLVLFAACSGPGAGSDPSEAAREDAPEAAGAPSQEGTALRAEPGRLTRQREEGPLVYYSGAITVSGRYSRLLDPASLALHGEQLCFKPDEASASLIPRDRDRRAPWFCFSDQEAAMERLSLPAAAPEGACRVEGRATVVVSNYVVDRTEGDVFDTATLERVVTSSTPTVQPCTSAA